MCTTVSSKNVMGIKYSLFLSPPNRENVIKLNAPYITARSTIHIKIYIYIYIYQRFTMHNFNNSILIVVFNYSNAV
jgi:hypothetical protein